MPKVRELTDVERGQITVLHTEGMSITQIAKKLSKSAPLNDSDSQMLTDWQHNLISFHRIWMKFVEVIIINKDNLIYKAIIVLIIAGAVRKRCPEATKHEIRKHIGFTLATATTASAFTKKLVTYNNCNQPYSVFFYFQI